MTPRQQPHPDTNAQPDYHCAFCGMPRDGSTVCRPSYGARIIQTQAPRANRVSN